MARDQSAKAGRPPTSSSEIVLCQPSSARGKVCHRVLGVVVPLTYGGKWDLASWREFLSFVRGKISAWSIWRWCTTLEESDEGKLHVHLTLQFRISVDRTSKYFAWKGRSPNASSDDYLGEGLAKNRRFLQQSVDRAFFYVFADKKGTQRDENGKECVDGNHFPSWVSARRASKYLVSGKWPLALWRQVKLTHERYEEYMRSRLASPRCFFIFPPR